MERDCQDRGGGTCVTETIFFSCQKGRAFYYVCFVGGEIEMQEVKGFDSPPQNTQLITFLSWDSSPHLFIC